PPTGPCRLSRSRRLPVRSAARLRVQAGKREGVAGGAGSRRRHSALSFTAADGTRLSGWHRCAEGGKPTVLYFHGNAGTLAGRAGRFRQILDSGYGLLAVSYRGYAGSEGEPSEAALFSDALELFDWLSERSPAIVLHGESLGTG